MIQCSRMLMIGATGRNQGKTELSCEIIKKFSKNFNITGLKVSTHYENDQEFHGRSEVPLKSNFEIAKHFNINDNTNTSRMLSSGAIGAYRIRAYEHSLESAFLSFIQQADSNNLIVCESNSLRTYVKPAIFIMIKNNSNMLSNKFSSEKVINFADLIMPFDEHHLNDCLEMITVENYQWKLKK